MIENQNKDKLDFKNRRFIIFYLGFFRYYVFLYL